MLTWTGKKCRILFILCFPLLLFYTLFFQQSFILSFYIITRIKYLLYFTHILFQKKKMAAVPRHMILPVRRWDSDNNRFVEYPFPSPRKSNPNACPAGITSRDGYLEYEVEDIIGHFVEFNAVTNLKVLWKGYPGEEATWEVWTHLRNCPQLVLLLWA